VGRGDIVVGLVEQLEDEDIRRTLLPESIIIVFWSDTFAVLLSSLKVYA
jgi:hypothetical protein